MRFIVLSLLLSAVSAAPLMAAEPAPSTQTTQATPLVIGETFTLESKAPVSYTHLTLPTIYSV